jgi:hypothetical protein
MPLSNPINSCGTPDQHGACGSYLASANFSTACAQNLILG